MAQKQWTPRIFNGGMNTDTDIRAVEPPYPNGDYLDSVNTRLSAIDNGFFNSRVLVKGNTEVPNEFLPTGDNKNIGSFEDRENNRIFSFNFNSEGDHGIYLYQDDVWRNLVHGEELAFNKERKITGVDIINGLLYWVDGKFNVGTKQIEGNAMRMLNVAKADDYQKHRRYNVYFQEEDIVNPLITFWQSFITIYGPDGEVDLPVITTYPMGGTVKEFIMDLAQKINDATSRITATGCDCHLELEFTATGRYTILFNLFKTIGISTTTSLTLAVPENFYPSPVKEEYISRTKYAPLNPPIAKFKTDNTYQQNFVSKKYFQFATQYVYDNNEYSCLSPISKLAYGRNYCGTEVGISSNNYVEVNFYDERLNNANSLSIIKNVNLYVRNGYLGEWRLVKTFERCDFNLSLSLTGENIFHFYNDGNYPVQAPELVQTENYAPLVVIGESIAQNRGYVAGTKEGYDNIDCVDTENELTYEARCTKPTGTLTGNFYIRNRAGGMTNYQPIYYNSGSGEVEYGGLSGAGFVLGPSQMTQQLDLRGFIIYSAQDPNGLNTKTEQRVPSGYGILTVGGEGNIYNIADTGSLAGIIDAMNDGEVYSTYSMELPVGKHIIRVASNLISSEPNSGMYSFPGNTWQTTSLCVKQVGTTGGAVTTYYHEAIVEITEDSTVNMDIEVWDMIPTDATVNQWLFMGYMLDAEGSNEIGDLYAAPRAERQLVQEASVTGGSTLDINGFGDLGVTDHNGFFYKLYIKVGSSLAGTANVSVQGANAIQAVSYGDSFYYNASGYILDGLVGIFDYSSETQLTLDDDNYFAVILYNHYTNYSTNCRTNIEGRVVNSSGDEIPGVKVLAHLTNRVVLTDGDGVYKMLVYADRAQPSDDTRQAWMLYKTGSNCCLSYPNGENRLVIVTPFSTNAPYNIDNPYPTSDFVLDINGFDVELMWKHRNMLNWGIVYFDVAGRRGRVNPAEPLFIPFPTDTNGNWGKPIWKWSINHTPPEWAVKYAIVRQLNPFYNRYLQFIIGDVQYVKLWDYTTDPPTPITTTFESGDATEISMSLLPIINYSQEHSGSILSYTPEAGDRLTFMIDSDGVPYTSFLDFEITSRGTGTFADPTSAIINYNNAIPELQPGTLVELYTPKKKIETDFFYEMGEVFDILNPGETDRMHGMGVDGQDQTDVLPATGYVYAGDTFVRDRDMFVLDGTEPNYYDYEVEDEYIYDDDVDSRQQSIGIPNISDPDYRQYDYVGRVRFSGLFNVDGNKLFNGLSTFEQSAFGDCDVNYGPVQRLARIGEQHEILAIQSHKVQPIYINKAILYEYKMSDGTLSASDSPLNFGIPFKAPFGTQHPESVVIDGNRVWAYDMFESVIWMYASGDLIPISETYRIKKKLDAISAELSFYDQNYVHVYGGLDRYNREVIWAFEKVLAVQPIGGIGGGNTGGDTGDGGVGNPGTRIALGELQDFEPVTLVYSTKRERWETRLDYYPEFMVALGGIRSFGFKDGQMWEANTNSVCCNFFGTQYKGVIQIVVNPFPGAIKDWYALREKSNSVWAVSEVYIPPTSRYPNGMKSRITKNNFRNFEGDWWAQFFKDMTDPSFTNTLEALQRGRELKGDVLVIALENVETEQAYINEIDINFTPSQETL